MMKIYLKNKKHVIKRITRESEGILHTEDLIRASDKVPIMGFLIRETDKAINLLIDCY
jgi:hypothetical protein